MTTDRRLFFLRHARADRDRFHGTDDSMRPLVDEGRRRTRDSARFMADLGLADVDVIVTSPLVRARETAQITAEELGLGDRVLEDPRLGLGFRLGVLSDVLADLPGQPRQVMLVGHEPGFSGVIGDLTGGEVVMRKGALARVDLLATPELLGELVWLLQPKVMLSGASVRRGRG